jgi:hypothetical protein
VKFYTCKYSSFHVLKWANDNDRRIWMSHHGDNVNPISNPLACSSKIKDYRCFLPPRGTLFVTLCRSGQPEVSEEVALLSQDRKVSQPELAGFLLACPVALKRH